MVATRTTIGDVARAAGVSKGTVSLAYSGKRPVSAATRQRVFDAADALRWTPSTRARALATHRTGTVGLAIARPPGIIAADDFFPRFIAGCESVLSDAQTGLLLNMVSAPEAEQAIYERYAAGGADGVILLDVATDDPRLALVAELELPATMLTASLPPADRGDLLSAVHTEDATAFGELVDLVVAAGHRRIAHVAGPLHYVHARARRDAFVAALERHGLPGTLVAEGDFSAASGRDATAHLLDSTQPPTAILYANDVMAIAGLSLARSRGLRVPEDLSITGFDDDTLSAHLSPGLTTVSTGATERGAAVAQLLLRTIAGEHPADIRLDCTRVVPRGSIAAPPR